MNSCNVETLTMERFQTGIEFLSSTESFITAHGKAQTIERCAGYFEEEPAVIRFLEHAIEGGKVMRR